MMGTVDYLQLVLAGVAFGAIVLMAVLLLRAVQSKRKLGTALAEAKQAQNAYEERFSKVIDADRELREVQAALALTNSQLDSLRKGYSEKRSLYDRLRKEIAMFDEKLSFGELGVYEPHFDYTDSERYKSAIEELRELQKTMISAKNAVVCKTEWSVDGSLSKGQTMINRNIRLTLRAFNNECDAAIANVRWNNAVAMENRIVRAREQIDKMNESNATVITSDFLHLKLKELRLTHEYREKLKQEKDDRAEATRLAREEQKLLRDLETALAEESKYQTLLERARAEAEGAAGAKLEALKERISIMEQELADAHARAERAQAMAEKTRSGYVYIASNVGSFGAHIFKIGLTRRIDPLDRVRELGDASVPFQFDTHAVIYSDDAPTLERALHAEFEEGRINLQNNRKEFFRTSLSAVEEAVQKIAPDAPFFRDVEAQEFRETIARRKAALQAASDQNEAEFPATI